MPASRWALAVAGVLLAVFVAIGWIQMRQAKLLDSAVYYTEDNITWVFSQLEMEYVALRDSLRQAQRYPASLDLEALRERYEIFVSRVALASPEKIGGPLATNAEHMSAVGKIGQFISHADPFLAENAPSAVTPQDIARLLAEMQPLADPIHDMSLWSAKTMGETLGDRNDAARRQGYISIALNIFQGLLTLVFAALLICQVRTVERRRRELEQARDEILRLNGELEERVRQRTAQLQATNRELQAFAYSVSHDLRAPLKTINGFSHLLERAVGDKAGSGDKAGEKITHYLSRIRAGTRQMGELIDGLLSLAQLSRGTLQFSEVDLSAIARRIEHECRERDPQRQAEVTIQNDMRVKGDARLLGAMMQNLLLNAWKFTSKRAVACIEVGSLEADSGETVYFVRDNGVGFDMAHAARLFGTFERLHSPADFPGHGIGLATVKKIIEQHAGRIWAQGQENEGATFYFTLGPAPGHGA
ncbi:MAG: sensor histidine kinase [Polaromonas sp.]